MLFKEWFRPPRHTLAVFLGLMLLFAGTLGWLGWRVLDQDRSLERERVHERLELVADHVAGVWQQRLSELTPYIDERVPSRDIPPSVILLVESGRSITVWPSQRILYYPDASVAETPSAVYTEGENLEFQHADPARAADVFRTLAQSSNREVRAGALLRLARNLRKLERNQEALQIYTELAQMGSTLVVGLPAELVAMEGKCSVLAALGRTDELRKAAAEMHSGLESGRWQLSRAGWEFHVDEARRWSGTTGGMTTAPDALLLSRAAESTYNVWHTSPEPSGRRIEMFDGKPVFVLWTSSAGRRSAVLAGPGYLDAIWTAAFAGQHARGAFVDADGHVVLGSPLRDSSQAVRTGDATHLPWTLYVSSENSGADLLQFVLRRRLLLAGFVILVLVLVAGSYFILHAIDRELAVAKAQSEFVSAVSHEFRTPLTSLCQLSEMLARGRVPNEELRQQSYEILARESERLQRLVESLLDFGRIEDGQVRYRLEWVDAVLLTRDLIQQFDRKVGQNTGIEFVCPSASLIVNADREALCLALWNLLDNAVKYSGAGSPIRVELAHDVARLSIAVHDRGIGIAAREQKQIFKKFVRGAGAAGIKGTGLGLTMAQRIVEAHRGEIRVTSAPGEGSTFAIVLPLASVQEQQAARAAVGAELR